MSVRRAAEVEVGETLPSLTVTVDRSRLVHYAGASGDRNVIHWDEQVARSVGLPDVIAHGMWTMGAAVEAVARWVGAGDRVVEYATRFTRPVVVPHDGGAEITVTGVVAEVDEEAGRAAVDLTVTCAGDEVLGRCRATVRLD